MPIDPRRRLDRRFPGDDLRRGVDSLDRLWARETPDRKDPIEARDQKPLPSLATRRTTRLADASPNAPLLIRIVRHPYALATTLGARQRYIPEAPPTEHVNRAAEIAGALADRERMRFTLTGWRRPKPFAVRPSTWVLLPGKEQA